MKKKKKKNIQNIYRKPLYKVKQTCSKSLQWTINLGHLVFLCTHIYYYKEIYAYRGGNFKYKLK